MAPPPLQLAHACCAILVSARASPPSPSGARPADRMHTPPELQPPDPSLRHPPRAVHPARRRRVPSGRRPLDRPLLADEGVDGLRAVALGGKVSRGSGMADALWSTC